MSKVVKIFMSLLTNMWKLNVLRVTTSITRNNMDCRLAICSFLHMLFVWEDEFGNFLRHVPRTDNPFFGSAIKQRRSEKRKKGSTEKNNRISVVCFLLFHQKKNVPCVCLTLLWE